MKLKIINKRVFIDDKEILNVSKLSIHKEHNMPDKITIEFHVDEVEEMKVKDGDYEVLKKIAQEKCNNHGTELVINGAIVVKDVDSEDLAKSIMGSFNKSSYR